MRMAKKLSSSNEKNHEEFNRNVIYSILGSVHKRRIITFIGERGKVGFTDLKKELKMSVGNLYYNLDALSPFITKDENRKYMLSEKGLQLYNILQEEEKRIKSILQPKNILYTFFSNKVLPLFVPRGLFLIFYKDIKANFIFFLLSLLLGIFVMESTRIDMIFLEIKETPIFSESITIKDFILPTSIWLALKPLINSFLIALILDIESRFLGFRKNTLQLYLSTIIAFIPLYIYPILLSVTGGIQALTFYQLIFLSLFYRILQVFSLGILTAILTIFRELTLEKAFILVFIMFYISFSLNFMVQKILVFP